MVGVFPPPVLSIIRLAISITKGGGQAENVLQRTSCFITTIATPPDGQVPLQPADDHER